MLPPAIDLTVIQDTTTSIRNSVHDVEITLVISTILVVLVVFLFLRNCRATLVPAVSVPLALLGTFGMMYLLGFSLDNFSLMALIVSTGFVVDNTIVVLENVTRHLEIGEDRLTAALQGRAGSGLHRPLHEHFAGGGVLPHPADGRDRRPAVPRIRDDPDHRDRHVADRVADRHADDVRLSRFQAERGQEPVDAAVARRPSKRSLDFYRRTLSWSLDNPKTIMFILLVTVVLNVYLLVIVPKGFFPEVDEGRIFGGIRGDQSISFQAMQKKFIAVRATSSAPTRRWRSGRLDRRRWRRPGRRRHQHRQRLHHPEAAAPSAAISVPTT